MKPLHDTIERGRLSRPISCNLTKANDDSKLSLRRKITRQYKTRLSNQLAVKTPLGRISKDSELVK